MTVVDVKCVFFQDYLATELSTAKLPCGLAPTSAYVSYVVMKRPTSKSMYIYKLHADPIDFSSVCGHLSVKTPRGGYLGNCKKRDQESRISEAGQGNAPHDDWSLTGTSLLIRPNFTRLVGGEAQGWSCKMAEFR